MPKVRPKVVAPIPGVDYTSGSPTISPILSQNEWISISKGSKHSVQNPSSRANIINSFSPIADDTIGLSSMELESLIPHNPLVDKLKLIDEKEGKDLKQKAKARTGKDNAQTSKKRNKGPRGSSPT